MSSYHQMGHDSWNLIPADGLSRFSGMVLSPVNGSLDETAARLEGIANRESLDVVLDPQFYIPRSGRGALPSWPYFDPACDSADLSDMTWWEQRCNLLTRAAVELGVSSVCSPAVLPRTFDLSYYDLTMECARALSHVALCRSLSVLLTAVISLRDLATPGTSERIASLLTRWDLDRVYLIFFDDLTARRQWTDADMLTGGMALVRYLERAGMSVLMGYCGLDMLLWKYAGATSVATGKFFNLRRFGPERWQEPQSEGRVVEYWTEPSLIAWLRENDVTLLLQRAPELITVAGNPFSEEILLALRASPREPWRALSWRQYLWWFSNLEATLCGHPELSIDALRGADRSWSTIEARQLLLFERSNDGSWIRPWLNAISALR